MLVPKVKLRVEWFHVWRRARRIGVGGNSRERIHASAATLTLICPHAHTGPKADMRSHTIMSLHAQIRSHRQTKTARSSDSAPWTALVCNTDGGEILQAYEWVGEEEERGRGRGVSPSHISTVHSHPGILSRFEASSKPGVSERFLPTPKGKTNK